MTDGHKAYLEEAIAYARARSENNKSCDRLSVGCIAFPPYRFGAYLEGHDIVNGANVPHAGIDKDSKGFYRTCIDAGHLMVDNHCVRTIHAEQYMLVQAMRYGINIKGYSLVVTHTPCITCSKLMIEAGIKEIYIGQSYKPDPITFQWFTNAGIKVYNWVFDPIKW